MVTNNISVAEKQKSGGITGFVSLRARHFTTIKAQILGAQAGDTYVHVEDT